MSDEAITAARAKHEREQHPGDLIVCPDPDCREVSREINREAAIAAYQRGLRWVGFEKKRSRMGGENAA